MTQQTPTIGRIVHYTSRGSADGVYTPDTRAAIITVVHDADEGMVGLAVLNPTGMFFDEYVAHSTEPLPGCWTWPPRT